MSKITTVSEKVREMKYKMRIITSSPKKMQHKKSTYSRLCTVFCIFAFACFALLISPDTLQATSLDSTTLSIKTATKSTIISSPAKQASGSASGSATVTTQNLRERIERIVEEKREQIKGVLTEISISQRGVVGAVQRVTEESITIRTHKGTEIIPLTNTAYTVELVKANKTITTTDIAVGDWLLALGVFEDDSFQPVRVLVSENSLRPRTRSIQIGSIATLTKTSIAIDSRNGSGQVSYTINKDTKYQDLSGEEIAITDIEESMQAIVAGYIVENTSATTTSATTEQTTTQRVAKIVRILTTVSEE